MSVDNVIDLATRQAVNLTDVGNGKRIVARHGENLRYLDLWNKWLTWDGQRWADDNLRQAEAWMKETLQALAADALEIADDKTRKQTLRHALASEGAGRVRGGLDMAKSEPGIPIDPDMLDPDPLLLNLANGTYDLATETRRPHDRQDLLTKLAPVTHNETATSPTWDTFLERILPDPNVRRYVQQLVGYSLTAKTGEQILPILYGSGANGKTTFLETIRTMLGDYGQVAPASVFVDQKEGIPNDIARLRGARFVMVSEISEGKRLNEALVKRLTGGDTLTARFLRAEFFEFKPQFKAWLATNHKPEIRGTDEAIWRRIRLIPFTVTIPENERDEDFPNKLLAELPGILNWALAGYMDWTANRLTTPTSVLAATQEYRAESDLIGGFLAERCEHIPEGWVRNGEIHAAYNTWAAANGGDELTPKAFSQRMAEKGYRAHRTKSAGRVWLEIELQPSEQN